METCLHDLETLLFQNRKIAVIGCHSWASVAYKTMLEYVQHKFKNCELIEPTIDMKSSLAADQECILDEMAKNIAADVAAYADPDTLIK